MGRSPWLRRLAHGFVAGFLLSFLQAPLGLDWTQVSVVQGASAALFRAAALLGLMLSLDPARAALRAGPRPQWILALALGFAVRSFGWDVAPATRAESALALLVATFVLRWLAGPRALAQSDVAPAAETTTLGLGERFGLVLTGLGSALALETLARELRLFTLGTAPEEALIGLVFLVLIGVAAAAFGPLLRKLADEPARFAAGLALGGAASIAGLAFLAQLSPDGLHAYLRRFDVILDRGRWLDSRLGGALGVATIPSLDGASMGTLWVTALLAAATLVAPAFLIGGTLGASKHVGRLAHVLAGAALGLLLLPLAIGVLSRPLAPAELPSVPFAWELVVAGATIAGLGAGVCAVAGARGAARGIGLAGAAVAVCLPWCQPQLVLWSFSPWSAATVVPELVVPSPEGLATIERAADGTAIATLDRRRLTPVAAEEPIDELRLRASFALLPASTRTRAVRALFIGQLTPARAKVLASLGALDLDRSAPWYAALPALEQQLFAGEGAPPGRRIPPAEARTRLKRGEYDWVVVPPIRGPIVTWKSKAQEIWGSVDAPRVSELDMVGEGLGVVWIAADSRTARGFRAERVVPAQWHFGSLSYGVCVGSGPFEGEAARAASGWLQRFESIQGPSPLAFLRTMPQQRAFELERTWTAAALPVGSATTDSGLAPANTICAGLALHYRAQQLSSPYETLAQQIEIDEDELRACLAAVPAQGPLDPFAHELWESLAWLLTEKRMPNEVVVYLEPVARRFAPWPLLERAVGHANRELLEPADALANFERVLAVQPLDIDLLVECAEAAIELGDPARAVGYLDRALTLQPGRADLERRRGLALLRAGDERGRAIVQHYLELDPDDAELRDALAPPPTDAPNGEQPPRNGQGR